MTYEIQAEVHKQLVNGFRLKVSIPSIGMYVNGFRVLPPKDKYEWYVLPPQSKVGNRWINIVEFDKSLDLWIDIERACINAVESYSDNSIEMTKEQHDRFMSEEIDKKFKDIDEVQASEIPWMNEDD